MLQEGTRSAVLAVNSATAVPGAVTDGMIYSLTLTPAAAAATLTLTDDSGTIYTAQAAANGNSFFAWFRGLVYKGTLKYTLAGTGATGSVEV